MSGDSGCIRADIHWLPDHKPLADNPKLFFPKFAPLFQRYFNAVPASFNGVTDGRIRRSTGGSMLLTRFWNNRQGSVAPMLGIAILPLLGAVGAAVDYTQASATRTSFQTALDSTALMLSKTAAMQTPADLQTAATNEFNALFTRTN